jgi:hypothetical protein
MAYNPIVGSPTTKPVAKEGNKPGKKGKKAPAM